MKIPPDLNYDDDRVLTEDSIRESMPDYTPVDSFNFKMNKDFMLAIALATNSGKDISIVYHFLSTMGKNNIVHLKPIEVYTKATVSKLTYNKLIARLQSSLLLIKLNTNTYMINPEMVLNFRKSPKVDRPQLLSLWSAYKKQYIYKER